MSRNTDKITKALAVKGYAPKNMIWEPVSPCDFGTDGGWYVEVVLSDEPEEYVDTILAYSTGDVLEEIEKLPNVKEDTANDKCRSNI